MASITELGDKRKDGRLPIETGKANANSSLPASTQPTPSYHLMQGLNTSISAHTPLSTCITPLKSLSPSDVANLSLATAALFFTALTLGLKYYWKQRKDRLIPLGGGGEFEVGRRWFVGCLKCVREFRDCDFCWLWRCRGY